jgi:M6 family metalloprotease-like protein
MNAPLSALLILATSVVGPVPTANAEESRSGYLSVAWIDSFDSGSSETALYLSEPGGKVTAVDVPEAIVARYGGLLALDGQRVTLTAPSSAGKRSSDDVLRVESLDLEAPGARRRAQTGAKRWLTIQLSFPDKTPAPKPHSYISSLMVGGAAPSINHYFKENSYGALDIDGADVVGPYVLPDTYAYYVRPNGNFGELMDIARISTDVVPLVDADVDFSSYDGINLVFSSNAGGAAIGTQIQIGRDGVDRAFGMTFLPPWAISNQGVTAHEMGHALGLPHSSGPYAQTYDSQWDVMSDPENCSPAHSTFGCTGSHTIAVHKDVLGWLPEGRRYDAPVATRRTISIDAHETPATGSNYLLALVPINVATGLYYSVEVRRKAGYDSQVPFEGVLIHRLAMNNDRPARVVDATVNDNTNDAGAIWTVGETFEDAEAGITVSVDAETATGFEVTIERTQAADNACAPAQVPAGNWRGEYFRSIWFNSYGLPVQVLDHGAGPLDVTWNTISNPSTGCGMGADFFSVRFTRTANFADGTYRFSAVVDEGYALFVDGVQVAAFRSRFGDVTHETVVDMTAGPHEIEVRYFEIISSAHVKLSWANLTGYDLAVPRPAVSVARGATVEVPVSILRAEGFTSPVTVSVPKLAAAKVKVLPKKPKPTTAASQIFTFKATKKSVLGTHDVTFTGVDAEGNTRTASIALTVTE